MNREEAIEILKAHHMWTGEPQEIIDVRKENKALDMAISALEQQTHTNIGNGVWLRNDENERLEQKPCEDERELAIECLEELKEKYIEGEGYERHPLPEYYAIETAIKSLSATPKPCEDAVSRDAVIKILEKYNLEMSKIAEDVSELPSVTHKSGEWIPFSERLPKPFEHCLITTTDGKVIYHYDDGNYSKYKAWMPLPKPYEPQESEEISERNMKMWEGIFKAERDGKE